jgi:hypothetical protein
MTFATPAFNSSAPSFSATPFLVFTGAITLSDAGDSRTSESAGHAKNEPDEYVPFNFSPSSSRNTNHKEL